MPCTVRCSNGDSQDINIHVSCSKPLENGFQFGSLITQQLIDPTCPSAPFSPPPGPCILCCVDPVSRCAIFCFVDVNHDLATVYSCRSSLILRVLSLSRAFCTASDKYSSCVSVLRGRSRSRSQQKALSWPKTTVLVVSFHSASKMP